MQEAEVLLSKKGGKSRSYQDLDYEKFEALMDAILESDFFAIEGFVESAEIIRSISRKEAKILWHLCWWSWQHVEHSERLPLNNFIAQLKGFYPWLLCPAWTAHVNPEAV